LARLFLGLNTYSHMFASVDLHNLFHFLKLRLHSHAQYEIRVYAEAMLELIEPVVPIAVKAWKTHCL
jgi:thymidylate synthase (FAD)